MRTLRVLVGIVGLMAMSAHAAHADNVQAAGTCDGLTVTAPPSSRVLIGVDAEPPYEVDDGNTRTVKFFQGADSHIWALTVLVDGVAVEHVDGSVDGCIPQPIPAVPAPPATAPSAALLVEVVAAPTATAVPAHTPWVGVELAPPW